MARYECRVQWDFGTTPPKSLDLSMNKVQCYVLCIIVSNPKTLAP